MSEISSQKSESPCTNKISTKDEKLFTSALLKPIYITVAYLLILRVMAEFFYKEANDEPFKKVWWSLPSFFSVAYLAMVFFGQRMMANRKEFQIKHYIFTYNLYQCILNLWCVLAMIYEVCQNPWFKSWWGNYSQPGIGGFRISFLVWIHYNNKYVELLDTLFMVLRKKNNQISFLHCYHHILLLWAWFIVCKFHPGGDVYFGALVNSFIHVIMYGYYTMALLNISCPWKKWITACQMIQFVICLTHACYSYYLNNMPRFLPVVQIFVMVNMLVLFGNFFVKSYSSKKKEA